MEEEGRDGGGERCSMLAAQVTFIRSGLLSHPSPTTEVCLVESERVVTGRSEDMMEPLQSSMRYLGGRERDRRGR